MKKRKIKDFPSTERPRERLVNYGASVLSDSELLAVILGTGSKGVSVYELSQNLILEFGDLKKIAELGIGELMKFPGIGVAKAIQIKAAAEFGRRIFSEREDFFGKNIKESQDAFSLFSSDFMNLKEEHLFCAYLDIKNKCLSKKLIAKGDLNIVYAKPREILKYALQENAVKLILAHNHPSGDISPSEDDIIFTKRIIEAGKIIGLEFLDHLIISDGKYLSMREKGYI